MFSCSGQHLLSEVRTSDQRSGRYAVEPHPACHPLDFCKLVRVPVPSHGKVVLRRLQVLPHGDHPAVCLSQITQQFLHLASVLPEPDHHTCLLYTSDAADDLLCVDLGGRRIIKKKKKKTQ